MSSSTSTSSTIANYAKKINQIRRTGVEIVLDNHHDGKVYTTFDALSGTASISAPHDAQFDEIQITLEGVTRTYVETVSPASTTSKTRAVHKFLKLVMPIQASSYPSPRIAEAGKTYTFPFNFVIPQQLLPTACAHESDAEHVQLAHLQLPPSMGDRETSIQDDLSPEMSKVQYSINVRVLKKAEAGAKPITLVEGLRKLQIIPAVAEAPPMSISADDGDEYILSKTKSLKKGMFSGKLGRITVSTSQTGAIVLPAPESSSVAGTMATVELRFDPHDAEYQPPRLGGLVTKIKAITFFAAKPAKSFPTRASLAKNYEALRQLYHTSVPLSSRCVETVSWKKHLPQPAYARRGSTVSSSSSEDSDSTLISKKVEDKIYYTAKILVPITLPSSKTWLPSFHSCIVSRTYSLDLTLSIHTPGAGVPASSVSLRLPVQIAAQGNRSAPVPLTAAEAAAELADANEYLRPRVIEVPSEAFVANSVLRTSAAPELPPSYEDFEESRRQVVSPSRS
ncbi:arrestin protein [Rutstroemia sp. NJR-2017a WRK4]|nr:arrestin protein [Rutstroemia sp. NJR-2017a WRK4]